MHTLQRTLYALLFALVTFCAHSVSLANGKVPTAEEILNNTAQGNEFWLAVPGNDDPQQPINALEFYVASSYDTKVTIEAPGFGYSRTVPLKALSVVTFTSKDQTANWQWEFWKSEEKLKYGIRISAPHPISVYVLNGKTVTSDGYLGIPTNVWGTKYIHNSYYDFNEFRPWKSGFVVIAKEKQTKVTITLKGKGKSLAKTVKGRRIGETWSVTLDPGDIYPVMGDGTTAGGFDLTGSLITSDKPVGFISFHQRAIIPFNAQNGRDYCVEMLPPVSAWGKTFYTVEFKRDNKGDFFRVVASKDNTTVEMVYMDKKEGTVLGRRTIKLSRAGDFWEDYNYWTGTGQTEGIRGVSVWKSDNPILVCQYSYSSNWDSGADFDPFMIVLTPVEQYLKATLFQTPNNKAFNKNFFGIIAEGDPNDPQQKKLKSLVFDGDTLYKKYPQILLNRIPGSNYYWGQLDFANPGYHFIDSKTRFGGYIYGFSEFDSYGWPAAMAFRNTSVLDTVPPPLKFSEECGEYLFDATELVKDPRVGSPGANGKDSLQEDTGIIAIELDSAKSYNYKLEITSPKELTREPKVERAKFKLSVIDKTKDAYAVIIVNDQADNFSYDTVYYYADKIKMDPEVAHFGKVRISKTKQMEVKLVNEGKDSVKITKVSLLKGKDYVIISGMVPPEITIPAGGTHSITIEFKPEKEGKTDEDPDLSIDSLLVETECAKFRFPVKGRGVKPCIDVEPEWDAGIISMNTETCKKVGTNLGLRITNKGTDVLTVTGIKGVRLPFKTTIQFPFTIEPGATYFAASVCFEPTEDKADSIRVELESDSQGDECSPTSLWFGRGKKPGPQITPYAWDIFRIKTVHDDGAVFVFNDGEDDVTLTGVALKDPTSTEFTITGTDQGAISPNNPYILRARKGNQVKVSVKFVPSDTTSFTNYVVASFKEQITDPVEGKLSGGGKLPVIKPTGYIFPGQTKVGDIAKPDGFVTIRNRSGNSDLYIESVTEKTDEGNLADFAWAVNAKTTDITIPPLSSVQIPVVFSPTAVGRRYIAVSIVSDAAPGPEENPRVTDTVHVVGYGWQDTSGEPKPEIDPLPFGIHMLCDQPSGFVNIRNTNAASAPFIIGNILFDGDLNGFNIDKSGLQYPLTLTKGQEIAIPVTFTPHLAVASPYKVTVVVFDQDGKEVLRTTITGESKIVPTKYELNVENSKSVLSAAGKVHTVNVLATSPEWANAKVDSLVLTLKYDTRLMAVQKITPLAGWNITKTEEKANSYTINLSTAATTPISSNTNIVSIEYLLTLADSLRWDAALEADVLSRKKCVTTETEGMKFGIDGCFANARGIKTGTGPMTSELNSQIIQSEDLVINSSIGIETTVTYELVNMLGQTLGTYGGQKLPAGDYSITLPTQNLGSGNYSVRVKAGPYTQILDFIIAK